MVVLSTIAPSLQGDNYIKLSAKNISYISWESIPQLI